MLNSKPALGRPYLYFIYSRATNNELLKAINGFEADLFCTYIHIEQLSSPGVDTSFASLIFGAPCRNMFISPFSYPEIVELRINS